MARLNVIGIRGRAKAGKDVVARILKERLKADTIALAAPLKRFLYEVFDFPREALWGPSEERNRPDSRYRRPDGSLLTPRFALQTLGTEWGRSCYENVWIDYALRRTRMSLDDGRPWVIIPDVRFPNEAKAVKDAGGLLWKVVRPGLTSAEVDAAGVPGHASEAFIDAPAMDALDDVVIRNDGTLEELRHTVAGAAELLRR